MEAEVRAIHKDGLLWGAGAPPPPPRAAPCADRCMLLRLHTSLLGVALRERGGGYLID